MEETTIKKKRGRPKKTDLPTHLPTTEPEPAEPKKRGRPRLTEEEKQQRAAMRKSGELPIQRRNRPDLAKWGQEYVEPGDNSKYLAHAMVIAEMPPVDTNDIHAVEERVMWYFNHCFQNDMKPTVAGLCNSLKIVRQTLLNWRTQKFRDDSYQAVVLKAYGIMESLWEDYMQNGKINPVSGIFLAKNNYGYQDKQEMVLTPNQATPETMDLATIEAKYAELPEDDE